MSGLGFKPGQKTTIKVPTWSDTIQAVQSQKIDRGRKFWMKKVEELHYPCSENKGADQLRGYREADLRLCFRICRLLVFSCGGTFIYFSATTTTTTTTTTGSTTTTTDPGSCGPTAPCPVWEACNIHLTDPACVPIYGKFGFVSITKTCPWNIQRFFSAVKIDNFNGKIDIFNIIAQNIYGEYTLEPPRRVPTVYVLDEKKKRNICIP